MSFAAALIYWIIVALWAAVLASVAYFYVNNPKTFGTARLLLLVIGIDTVRNIIENIYFGLYFGGQYGFFSHSFVAVLGQPNLLLLPKLANVASGCLVLGLLLYHWLPSAIRERNLCEQRAHDFEALAATDALTGLNNRREFEQRARAELLRSQRYIRPLTLMMIDIDHFKIVNDSFGHHAGDMILKVVASTINNTKRESDIAGRVGGEEFAVLLPETTKEDAWSFAERLCVRVRECSPAFDGVSPALTVSIGLAAASAGTAGIETLMRQADQALYEAKRSGRDRIVIAAPTQEKLAIAAE